MIQINLIPDVKREFLKAQRTKHTFVAGSILISIVAATATVLVYLCPSCSASVRQKCAK